MENQLYFDRKKFHAICSRLGGSPTIPELNKAFAAAMSTDNPDDEVYRKLTDAHLVMDFDIDETMNDEGYSILDECEDLFADAMTGTASPQMMQHLYDDNFFDEFDDEVNYGNIGFGLDEPEDYEDEEYLYA